MSQLLNKLTINLDLDGVLADFAKAAVKLHGPNYEALGKRNPVAFWRPITKEIDNFFSTLDMMHDAMELYSFVSSIPDVKIRILTALPRPEGKAASASKDKTDWVHRHIDPSLEVITVIGGRNKGKYVSAYNDILIDDLQRNIDVWEAEGGRGILHTSASNTIKQLEEIILI
jgi:5'(3')-deoxyribonucleotidase